jgi:hypothetical protein
VLIGPKKRHLKVHCGLLAAMPKDHFELVMGKYYDRKPEPVIDLSEWNEEHTKQFLAMTYIGERTPAVLQVAEQVALHTNWFLNKCAYRTLHSYLETKPLTLFVGPKSKPLTAHSGLLMARSDYFQVMLLGTGNWVEKHTFEIDWSEWSEDTAARFLEWAYTGKYTSPPWESVRLAVARDAHLRNPTSLVALEKYMRLREEHHTTLMVHARVYVLAQYTYADPLGAFALQNIRELVADYLQVDTALLWVNAVAELARYVYDNTISPDNYKEPLRDLLSSCLADGFPFGLYGDQELNLLLGDDGKVGGLARDVMRRIDDY